MIKPASNLFLKIMPFETDVALKATSGTGWVGLGRKSPGGVMLRAPWVLTRVKIFMLS